MPQIRRNAQAVKDILQPAATAYSSRGKHTPFSDQIMRSSQHGNVILRTDQDRSWSCRVRQAKAHMYVHMRSRAKESHAEKSELVRKKHWCLQNQQKRTKRKQDPNRNIPGSKHEDISIHPIETATIFVLTNRDTQRERRFFDHRWTGHNVVVPRKDINRNRGQGALYDLAL